MRSRINILGWVTLPPEIKFTTNQKRIMTMGMNAGGRKDHPNFHNIVIFERSFDYVQSLNLKKGDIVQVEGKQVNKKYSNKETGKTTTWSEVLMDDLIKVRLDDSQSLNTYPVDVPDEPEDETGGGTYDDVPF